LPSCSEPLPGVALAHHLRQPDGTDAIADRAQPTPRLHQRELPRIAIATTFGPTIAACASNRSVCRVDAIPASSKSTTIDRFEDGKTVVSWSTGTRSG
jgi:hypothetical protein